MKKTSKFSYAIFLISTILLSACSQAAISPTQTLAAQVTTQPQTSSTPAPSAFVPLWTPTLQASNTPTPTTFAPPTVIPTQLSGASGNFVAYASGLASTFTKGDICSLEQPFVLEGSAPPISSGLIANFTPSSSSHGEYTFTNNILDGQCVDSSNGTYDVKFFTSSEGDIIMTGTATRVCQGVTTFSGTTEFHVAIRGVKLVSCP
jgi:hypothetical protein